MPLRFSPYHHKKKGAAHSERQQEREGRETERGGGGGGAGWKHTPEDINTGKTAAAVSSSCAAPAKGGTLENISPAHQIKFSILQDVLKNMAPLDMCGGGAGGGGGNGGSDAASFGRGRAMARRPSCEDASSAKESQEPPLTETAGERRRSRAAKLRETRSRNAARIQQQVYTSAEDSEEEVRKSAREERNHELFFARDCCVRSENVRLSIRNLFFDW